MAAPAATQGTGPAVTSIAARSVMRHGESYTGTLVNITPSAHAFMPSFGKARTSPVSRSTQTGSLRGAPGQLKTAGRFSRLSPGRLYAMLQLFFSFDHVHSPVVQNTNRGAPRRRNSQSWSELSGDDTRRGTRVMFESNTVATLRTAANARFTPTTLRAESARRSP